MAQGKILVIRGGAIGDFILTLPVLAALKDSFPSAHLTVLGYPSIASLAASHGLADEVQHIDSRPMASFFSRKGVVNAHLADFFRGFSIIISYLYDPDSIFRENVKVFSKAQFIEGPHRPDEMLGLHATETFLKPLERLAIYGPDPVPRLKVHPLREHPLQKGAWLAIHPGSGSETKNWPEHSWVELLDLLMAHTDWNVLFLGGEADGERVQRLYHSVPADRRTIAFNKPLPEVAGWLTGCKGFIGHDSGITHLASAVGLPVVVLWGPSKRQVWQPIGESVDVIQHENGLTGIEPTVVFKRIGALIG